MNPPLVHVLVINWNGLRHLAECFNSLLTTNYPNVRFILVDNGSTDGSVAFVQQNYGKDARVEILQCPRNLGWAGGNNLGMERSLAAGADYIFLLNNDTVTAHNAIAELVRMAAANPRIGALAAHMMLYDNPDLVNSVGLACSRIAGSWDIGIGRIDSPALRRPGKVIGACGGAAFYRSSALRVTGLLPPDFDIYLDDLDICLRMWDAGYEVWSCPAAVVRHKYSATMGEGKQARRKYYLNTRNRARVILLNYPLVRILQTLPAFKLGEARAVGRALLDGELWRVWAHVRSWFGMAAYIPRAIRRRFRRHEAAPGTTWKRGRFWPLIVKRPAFFPGTEFPKDGWYAARNCNGVMANPIAARAILRVANDRLRVTAVNCYPAIGPASVEIRQDGVVLGLIKAASVSEATFKVTPGLVEFVARRIFYAEETGERIDIGGWLIVG